MEPGRVDRSLLVHGVELSWWEEGEGPPLLCLHETAATAEVWRPLAEALGGEARTVAPHRRGWGASGAPQQYSATTIEEQAEDAAALLEQIGLGPAVACGAGLGAVAALDLVLRRDDLVRGAVLVEPPLLALVPEATEGLSADRESIAAAVAEGGPPAALDLYLAGGLPFAGPGAERIPDSIAAAARERPLSLFAELAAVPGWVLRTGEMAASVSPARVVVGASTPPVLLTAAERLASRLGGAELARLEGEGLPQVSAAPELAEVIRPLL